MSDGRTVKKKIRPGPIELDPDEIAIKVHYEVESTTLNDLDVAINVERKQHSTKIKLKSLTASSNISKLADDVVRKCKYIHPSKGPLVEQLLAELQHRKVRRDLQAEAARDGGAGALYGDDPPPPDRELELEEGAASMDHLDDYLEMLYGGDSPEEMAAKAKGTALILQLCHYVGHLEHLIQNHTLMGALSRVLNEEYKKSIALSYNIMRVFLAFSNFMEMHPILATYKVGAMTMKVIELELTRAGARAEERKQKRLERERKVRAARDNQGGEAAEAALREKAAAKNRRDDAKFVLVAQRQEKLLFVCFHVLINLAEDPVTERKMVKRDLAASLTALLDRTSANLLALVVTFLKKLSIFQENKDRMVALGTALKLVKFVPCSCEPLVHMALRLLYNLSFDAGAREQMVKGSLLPKLVELLKKPPYRGRVLRLLYHLSADDRCKSMFTYTEAVPLVMQLVINFPQQHVARELAALGVNLSLNARNAELMAAHRGLHHLMDRQMHTRDPLLMKIIRNLAQWTFNIQQDLAEQGKDPRRDYRQRGLWAPFVRPLCKLVRETEQQDLVVEALGTVNNLTALDLPKGAGWADLVEEFQLQSFIPKLLVPGMAQADVVLEVVILVGVLTADPKAVRVLALGSAVQALQQVWRDHAGDDAEVVLQLLHAFYLLLHHEPTREIILFEGEEQTINCMLQALNSRHAETAAMADRCLDLVLEFDRDAAAGGRLGELGRAVRAHRFRAHNRAWLRTLDQDEFAQTRHGHDEGSYKYDSDADAPPGNGGVYGGGGGGHHPGGGFPEDSMDHGSGEVDPRLLMDYGGQHERVAMDMGMLYTQQAGHAAPQPQPNPGSSDGGGGRRPGEHYDGYDDDEDDEASADRHWH